MIAAWRGPGTLLAVPHGANVQALVGGANLGSGEIVVVAAAADGSLGEMGRIAVPNP